MNSVAEAKQPKLWEKSQVDPELEPKINNVSFRNTGLLKKEDNVLWLTFQCSSVLPEVTGDGQPARKIKII